MFIRNGLRFNIYAAQTLGDVFYPNFLDPALRASLGITEVADPMPPDEYQTHPEYWYRTEQDDAPYVVYTRKSDEQITQVDAAKIPRRVTMRQARLALLGAGLLEPVETALASLPDGAEKAAAKIEWEYAQEVDRDHQWVQNLSAAMGLTEQQLDVLFVQASAL
jgi:hypothetical protein